MATFKYFSKYALFFTLGILGLHQIIEIDFQDPVCMIKAKKPLKNFMRKPLNCDICARMEGIDSLDFIQKDVFETEYGYNGRPLVVRRAAISWNAIKTFNFDFFKKLNNNSDLSNCQFLTYNNEFNSLNEVFYMDEKRINEANETNPWYCGWSVCDPAAVKFLRNYYDKPYFLPDTSENYIVDWIFMGSKGYGAPLHIDDVKLPSWQAQIHGAKRWVLQTPSECLYKCNEVFFVDVMPGDIIVLDTNLWYHRTEVISTNISITIGAEYD